jgi:hypothetical protein
MNSSIDVTTKFDRNLFTINVDKIYELKQEIYHKNENSIKHLEKELQQLAIYSNNLYHFWKMLLQ